MAEALRAASTRASDADREYANGLLRDALASGQIDTAELDTRMGLVAQSTTLGDLQTLLDDLGVDPICRSPSETWTFSSTRCSTATPGADPGPSAPSTGQRSRVRTTIVGIIVLVAVFGGIPALIINAVAHGGSHHSSTATTKGPLTVTASTTMQELSDRNNNTMAFFAASNGPETSRDLASFGVPLPVLWFPIGQMDTGKNLFTADTTTHPGMTTYHWRVVEAIDNTGNDSSPTDIADFFVVGTKTSVWGDPQRATSGSEPRVTEKVVWGADRPLTSPRLALTVATDEAETTTTVATIDIDYAVKPVVSPALLGNLGKRATDAAPPIPAGFTLTSTAIAEQVAHGSAPSVTQVWTGPAAAYQSAVKFYRTPNAAVKSWSALDSPQQLPGDEGIQFAAPDVYGGGSLTVSHSATATTITFAGHSMMDIEVDQ